MAKIHGSPRTASRHSGSRYGSGYQYRNPDRIPITLGPWERVVVQEDDGVLGVRELGRLENAILKNGAVRPLWETSLETLSGKTALGSYQFTVGTEIQQVVFYRRDADNTLDIEQRIAGVSTITNFPGLSPSLDRISATLYGRYVYFTQLGLGKLQRFDTADATVAPVEDAPEDASFVAILNDHLLALKLDPIGNFYELFWSVNGDFEDWLGEGSGNRFVNTVGDVKGMLQKHDLVMIVGTNQTLEVYPTGTVPSFLFRDSTLRCTNPLAHTVATMEDVVFTTNHLGDLFVNRGGERLDLSRQVTGVRAFWPSDNLRMLLITVPGRTLFLDLETFNVVGHVEREYDAVSDASTDTIVGYVNSIGRFVHNLHGSAFDDFIMQTGYLDFGEDLWLDFMAMIADTSTPDITILAELMDSRGSTSTKETSTHVLNAFLSTFTRKARFRITSTEAWTSLENSISQLNLMAAKTSSISYE